MPPKKRSLATQLTADENNLPRATRSKRRKPSTTIDTEAPIKPHSTSQAGQNAKTLREAKKRRSPKTKSTGKNRPSPEKQEVYSSPTAVQVALINTSNQVDRDSSRNYWLMKAEPESRMEKGIDVKFSIDDLAARTEPEAWDGVRNYVARNNMRAMKEGDLAFFYHSNCKVPGIVGIMEIVKEHSPDENAWDPKHPYYDAKDSPEKQKWSVVHVAFRRKFSHIISLTELKTYGQAGGPLDGMDLLKLGRLSVGKVTPAQWEYVLDLADKQVDTAQGEDGKPTEEVEDISKSRATNEDSKPAKATRGKRRKGQ